MKKGERRCKSCGTAFTPHYNKMQPVCSVPCSINWSKTEDGKKYYLKDRRRDTADRKRAIKTKADWMAEAQVEFNKYIRARDRDDPCISCGRFDPPVTRAGQWHSGHFMSVGAYTELRFDPNNCHKECLYCNNFDAEHLVSYRIHLIEKVSLEVVLELEGPHDLPNWLTDDLQAIKRQYRKMTRALELQV